MTDCMKAIAGINVRFYDVMYKEPETRTGDEVVTDIRSKLKALQ